MTTDGIENTETDLPVIDLPRGWAQIDRAIIAITKLAVVLIGAAFTVMIISEVASRFLFNFSMSQTNATARFLLVWFFLIGAGLALRQGGHVGLLILVQRAPPVLAGVLFVVAQMFILTFFVLMIWSGYLAFLASRAQVEGSLGISLGWVMAAFPVGFALLIYHQAAMAVGALRLARKA